MSQQSGHVLVFVLDDLEKTNATVRRGGSECFTEKINLNIVLWKMGSDKGIIRSVALQGYGLLDWSDDWMRGLNGGLNDKIGMS